MIAPSPTTTCPQNCIDGWLIDPEGRAYRCPCHAEQRKAVQRAQLGEFASSTFDVYRTDFEFERDCEWNGYIVTPDRQRAAVLRAWQRAQAFAADPRDEWFYVCGPAGTGKTRLVCAIANALIDAGRTVVFSNVPDLMDALREGYSRDGLHSENFYAVLDRLKHADVLILDDLAAERSNAWTEEQLYKLIDYRTRFAKTTIITSNVRLRDLSERINSRIAGRAEECVIPTLDQRWRK